MLTWSRSFRVVLKDRSGPSTVCLEIGPTPFERPRKGRELLGSSWNVLEAFGLGGSGVPVLRIEIEPKTVPDKCSRTELQP